MASTFCSAYNCGSKYGDEGVTLHRFPVEKPNILTKWVTAIRKPKWHPTKNNYLCNLHFTDDKFVTKSGYRFLRYDAVPTKFHVLPRPKALFPKEWSYRLFTVKEVDSENSKGFAVEAKIAVDNEDNFKEWLQAHEKLSKVPYRLAQKYNKINKHLCFKAEFGCRHSTMAADKSKVTQCPAKLLVRIRAVDPKFPRSKDMDPLSYPCTVVIYHLHNHNIESNVLLDIENTVTEDIADEVKIKFTEMYKGMYTQEEALNLHQADLQEEYADEYEEIAQDKYLSPDAEWVKKFYQDLKEDLGEITQDNMLAMLTDEVTQINGEKGKAKIHKIEEHVVVALCTPLMERSHSLKASGEIVFLDSSGYLERCKCYVYIVMSYSCTEGLPLGVLLTTSDSESILVSGFQLLSDLLPEKAFGQYGSLGPEAFFIENNESIQNCIKAVFPESTVLLCSFTMLKAIWYWLWNAESKIEVQDRCHLFTMVHEIMMTQSAEDFRDMNTRIVEDEITVKYPDFQEYFQEISSLSERWAVCMKNEILDKDKEVSAVEIASHVLKDKMYLTKAYNISQLFRFLANDLESYYKQKINHCINNTLEKFIQFSYKQEMRAVEALDVEVLSSSQYKVTHKKSGNAYFVDMDLWVCSCSLGINGSRCRHQYAVCVSKKLDLSSTVPPDEIIKKELHWIATNSLNSLFGNMDPESGDSEAAMEDEEYNPRQEFPKKFVKPKVPKKPTQSPKEEARVILERVVKDIIQRYEKSPTEYHRAIVSLAVNYQTLFNDSAIITALSNFGKSS